MRKPSKTDLTDAPWKLLKPLIPPARLGGRPREVDRREVLNTRLSQARTGGPGERLPHDRRPKSTVSDSVAPWRDDGPGPRIVDALRTKVRVAEGREATPRIASLESPTVKTTELGGEHGSDAATPISGRTRPLDFASLGRRRAVVVRAASADDGATAPRGLGPRDRPRCPRRATVGGDGTSRNQALDAWLEGGKKPFAVQVVERPKGSEGFMKRPKRWVAERSLAWLGRDRRPSQDDEWDPASSEAWVRISAIGGMLRRLAPEEARKPVPFTYEKRKAA